MNTSAMMNVVMMQCRRHYVNLLMNVFAIMYVSNTQLRWYCAIIPINEFCNINALMMQRRRCYANITMNVSATLNTLISQLGTSCSFDSPGLARNEPTPGKRSQGDSTP